MKSLSRPAKKKTIKSIIPDKKKCDDCKKELIISNFYNTNNVLSDGKSSICKKCTKKESIIITYKVYTMF